MQENNMDYVPANIVKMLFEQSQKAIEANTIAVDKMTSAVNELTKFMALPPTKRDILDEIKEHEGNCGIRSKEIMEDDEKFQANRRIEDEKRYSSISNGLNTIQAKVNTVYNKVNLMITVVLIVFGLLSITYIYVNNSVNTSVKQVLETHIQNENKQVVKPEVPNAPK